MSKINDAAMQKSAKDYDCASLLEMYALFQVLTLIIIVYYGQGIHFKELK